LIGLFPTTVLRINDGDWRNNTKIGVAQLGLLGGRHLGNEPRRELRFVQAQRGDIYQSAAYHTRARYGTRKINREKKTPFLACHSEAQHLPSQWCDSTPCHN